MERRDRSVALPIEELRDFLKDFFTCFEAVRAGGTGRGGGEDPRPGVLVGWRCWGSFWKGDMVLQ